MTVREELTGLRGVCLRLIICYLRALTSNALATKSAELLKLVQSNFVAKPFDDDEVLRSSLDIVP